MLLRDLRVLLCKSVLENDSFVYGFDPSVLLRNSTQRMKLQNLVTVVTGASQGLGRAIAEEFVRQGAHVAICARDSNLLETVRSDLEDLATSGQKIIAQIGDVSSPDQMDEFFRCTEREIG